MRSTYKLSKEENNSFKYVGLNVVQTREGVKVDQNVYINELETIEIDCDNDENRVLTNAQKKELRKHIGQVLWVSRQTRPDSASYTCETSVRFKDATQKDIKHLNKTINYLKQHPLTLTFKNMGDLKKCKIMGYSDASFLNLPDENSEGEFIIFLVNPEGIAIPIHWRSSKVRRVVRSTLSAETLALAEAAESIYLLKMFLAEVLGVEAKNILTELITDCKTLYDTVAYFPPRFSNAPKLILLPLNPYCP